LSDHCQRSDEHVRYRINVMQMSPSMDTWRCTLSPPVALREQLHRGEETAGFASAWFRLLHRSGNLPRRGDSETVVDVLHRLCAEPEDAHWCQFEVSPRHSGNVRNRDGWLALQQCRQQTPHLLWGQWDYIRSYRFHRKSRNGKKGHIGNIRAIG